MEGAGAVKAGPGRARARRGSRRSQRTLVSCPGDLQGTAPGGVVTRAAWRVVWSGRRSRRREPDRKHSPPQGPGSGEVVMDRGERAASEGGPPPLPQAEQGLFMELWDPG